MLDIKKKLTKLQLAQTNFEFIRIFAAQTINAPAMEALHVKGG